jgi:hypothetical protein
MKRIFPIKHLLMVVVLLITITPLISGCSYTSEFGVNTIPIERSSYQYKVVFQKNHYSYYVTDFIPQKAQLILAGVDEVDIVDLNTGKLSKRLKLPEIGVITSTYVSKNGAKLYLYSVDEMQIWNTSNWTLSRQLKAGKHPNRLSGFTKDKKILYFAGTFWSGDTFSKIFEYDDGPIPNGYDFSPDNRYFVYAGHFGIPIVDIEAKKWTGITYLENGASQVSFRDNASFFASYGAKLDITKGGYLPEELGLFDIRKKDILGTFSPSSRISCWVNSHGSGLLVSLYNGDIYHLSQQLDIQDKWHIDDYVRVCKQGNNDEIWLGGDKTGLYKADLAKGVISHEYKTNNSIFRLSISPDNKYLGLEELLPAERMETVLFMEQ